MTKKLTETQIKDLAHSTSDAYSFDRYANWEEVVRKLARRGLDARQIEAVVRSKWTRWAADMVGRYENIPAKAVIDYIDKCESDASIKALTAEHFGE